MLWWCSTPLACQPVAAARHLRDWLLNMQYDGGHIHLNLTFHRLGSNLKFTDAPETLVSILKCLGETMTVHVACTTWDKQFRLALVASSLPIDYQFESQEFYSKKTRVFRFIFLVISICEFPFDYTNVCLIFRNTQKNISKKVQPQLDDYGASCCTRWQHFVTIVISTVRFRMSCQ